MRLDVACPNRNVRSCRLECCLDQYLPAFAGASLQKGFPDFYGSARFCTAPARRSQSSICLNPVKCRAAADGADVTGKDSASPCLPAVLDHARRRVGTALRAAVDDDARHGAHVPNHGTPDIPSAVLDQVRPTGTTARTENVVPKEYAQTRKNKCLPEKSVEVRRNDLAYLQVYDVAASQVDNENRTGAVCPGSDVRPFPLELCWDRYLPAFAGAFLQERSAIH